MKFNKNWFNKDWFPYTVATCSAVVLYLLLSQLGIILGALKVIAAYFSPVFTGIIIAYVLHPLVSVYETRALSKIKNESTKRTLSVVLALVTVALFIVLLMIALIPQIAESISTFIANLDGYAASLEALLESVSSKAESYHLDLTRITSRINNFLSDFSRQLPAFAEKAINVSANIGRSLVNVVLGLILAVYFLIGKDNIKQGGVRVLKQLIKPSTFRSIAVFWHECDAILIKYITYDLLDGLIVGLINWLFMVICNIPYAVLISVFVGITNLAPTFGPILGAVIGAFILVLVDPIKALIFIIFTVVLQTMDGYVLKPKLFGGSLNVPAIWILVTLVVGGRMFGIAGIMLAIPFAAIFNVVYTRWLEKKEAVNAKAPSGGKEG